jgi:hypothetical protein
MWATRTGRPSRSSEPFSARARLPHVSSTSRQPAAIAGSSMRVRNSFIVAIT